MPSGALTVLCATCLGPSRVLSFLGPLFFLILELSYGHHCDASFMLLPARHITAVPGMPHVSQRETFTCSALLVTRPCCSLKACSWGHVWEWLFLTKHHWIWR